MNKDDSERMAGTLVAAGFQEAESLAQADIVIFNTCSVRQNAEDKLYGQVSSLKNSKKENQQMIVVGGCLAQTAQKKLLKELNHIDLIFGPSNIAELPELIAKKQKTQEPIVHTSESSSFAADLPAKRVHKWHSWLPITVGCNNFCSYCIVPYARGRERSRPLEKLLDEAARLVNEGVIEITLLGQNVNSYGRDLYGQPQFVVLLQELAKVKGLKRIRFTTSHPKDFNLKIVDVVAAHDNLCPHFHIPLQAGSDKVLKAMRRGYSLNEYLAKVKYIRETVPEAAVTTDLMVGFPGETEADFQETLTAVKEAQFDQAFMFIYSPRPGTKAATLPDQVTEAEKNSRFQRLSKLQNEICQKQNEKLVGKTVNVFVEAKSKKRTSVLTGRTDTNKLVHFQATASFIGQFVNVKITKALSTYLLGELENYGADSRSASAASAHSVT